jgi:hypothetical protein
MEGRELIADCFRLPSAQGFEVYWGGHDKKTVATRIIRRIRYVDKYS